MSLPPTEVDAHAELPPRRLGAGLRLLALAAAMVAGAAAFLDFCSFQSPWWRWLLDLTVGWGLLIVSFRDGQRPAESVIRRRLRWAAGAIAVLMVALAVVYGLRPGGQIVAIPAAFLALVAFLCSRWTPFDPADIAAVTCPPVEPRTSPEPWRFVLAAVAVLACLAVPLWNPTNHLGAFLLWLLSLTLYAVACWRRDPNPPPPRSDWQESGGPSLSRSAEAVALFLIFALAGLLRLALLEEIPHTIPIDECLIGRYAENIWSKGFPDAFGFGWNAYAHLSFITHYWGIQLFGMSMANLRLASAAFGLLTLPPVYFWVRRWWGNVVALLATFLLAVNSEHLYFSRVGFNCIQVIPIAALVLVAFARVLRTGRAIDWVWLGYAMGLGLHTYHSAKQYPGLLVIAALFLALGVRGFLKRYLGGAVVGAVAYALVVIPLVPSIYGNWLSFRLNNENRVDAQILVDAWRAYDGATMWAYVGGHFGDELRRFFTEPPGTVLLSPPVSVLFLLGVGWLLWRWRDPRNLVALAWIGGILFAVGFTIEPRFQRRLGFFPVVVLLPALVAGHARALMHRCWPRRADLLVAPLLLAWLGTELYHGWHSEFVVRGGLRHPTAGVCRLMQRIPSPVTYYTAGESSDSNPNGAADICMLAADPERRVVNLAADADIVPVPPSNQGVAVLLVFPPMLELIEMIRHYYPEVEPEYYKSGENVAVYQFILQPQQVEAHRGLGARYRSGERSSLVPAGVTTLAAPADSKFPIDATARGLVWIAPTGEYGFRAGRASVAIDEQPVSAGEAVKLVQGWHSIEVSATLERLTDRINIEWHRPDQPEWEKIPGEALNTHPEAHGLLGRYFARVIPASGATPIAEPPDASSLESTLSFDWFVPIDPAPPAPLAAKPSTMEWIGSVALPEGEQRSLRLYASSPTEVFIDGKQVFLTSGDDGRQPIETTLSAMSGRVPILVRSTRPDLDPQARWILRLLWSAPGGGWNTFVDYRPPPADRD